MPSYVSNYEALRREDGFDDPRPICSAATLRRGSLLTYARRGKEQLLPPCDGNHSQEGPVSFVPGLNSLPEEMDASHAWAPGTPSADEQVHNTLMQHEVTHDFSSKVKQGCVSSEEVMDTGRSYSAAEEVKLPRDMPHQLESEGVEQRGSGSGRGEKKLKGTRRAKVKRKKHRPKVVQEGWSVKKKPVTPEQVPPKPVRKYGNRTTKTGRMRKRKDLNSVEKPSEATNGISIGKGKSADQDTENHTKKPVRRKLNFEQHIEPVRMEAESHAMRMGMGMGMGMYAGSDSNYVPNLKLGQGMEDMIENPTAGIIFHQEEHIRPPPIQLSRRELLMRNWMFLARKSASVSNVSNTDNLNFVGPTEWKTVQTQIVDTDMIIAENDREVKGAKRQHSVRIGNVQDYKGTAQIVIWNQTKSQLWYPQIYKRKKKTRKAQDGKCDLLMQGSSRASESVFIYDKLLQALKKPPQSYIDYLDIEQTNTGQGQVVLHPLESISNMDHVHKLTGGHYGFFEQNSVGLTASIGDSQENNFGHSISYSGIISNSQEPYFTKLISQAIVPYALRTEDAFSQQQEDIRFETPNALVPYGGHFAEVKKRRPRAKVDLDEESNRMWNLLMGKQRSDVEEESDVDKEKWEEERRLFHGRVDSFIARMHLIQGDRRFSQWKGSVLDSVVGVFLTQNVSDTLSSSAFMSLAAKFPLRDNDAECNAERMQKDGSPPPSSDAEAKMERTDDSFNRGNRVNDNNFDSKEKDSKSFDWDSLRKEAYRNGYKLKKTDESRDSLDWEAVRCANVKEISGAIQERGQNNILAERIQEFLNRIFREHGSLDLEWLRHVPPDKTKDYLLSIRGLGLKSVECIRLLALNQLAFPVDTNVARICVRLGWVPIQLLPEDIQLHLLELYPVMEKIQKYLWPRLCKLDQRTLYELHYQMITFGKVFCTKRKPNCNSCPMRAECRHFASASASITHALPGPSEKCSNGSATPTANEESISSESVPRNCEPIIEIPPSMLDPECMQPLETDIEGALYEDPDDIPEININLEEFRMKLQNCMKENMELQDEEMTKAIVAISREAASIPITKLKFVSRLRTEHHVYELPDSHPLLEGLDRREPDDPCPYLLNIWTPGETAQSTEPPETCCNFQDVGKLCDNNTCFSCNSMREEQAQIVRGTLLIPCRTALRGRFPLNGTYFQVNEVFADDETSHNPIDVRRKSIWNLPRRTVYMGSGTIAMFREQSVEKIRTCFNRGFICTRGFDRRTRAPRPICTRLHCSGSKAPKSQKGPVKEAKKPMKNRQSRT